MPPAFRHRKSAVTMEIYALAQSDQTREALRKLGDEPGLETNDDEEAA